MTTCLGRVSRVRSICLMLALSACLVAVGSECLASPFQLVFRNDSDATLIPYRVAKTVDGDRVRVADPSGAIAPGAEVEIASTGFDPIFFDPESRRALLLDTRSGDRPSVLAAVFEYETTPATDGSRSPVRKEVSRTAFAMNTVRTNVLVLSADWSVHKSVQSSPVIVQTVRPVVYEAPARVVIASPPVVRVIRTPPPPPVRVYVRGPYPPAPRVWVRW